MKQEKDETFEGKTKIMHNIETADELNNFVAPGYEINTHGLPSDKLLVMEQKPVVTIGDGAQAFIVPGKDELVNAISYNLFTYLESQEIPTHVLCKLSANSMLVRKADMLKAEVIVRGISVPKSSYAKRYPETTGQVLNPPIVELFYKGRFFDKKKLRNVEDPLMIWNDKKGFFDLYLPKERPSPDTHLGTLSPQEVRIPGSREEIASIENLALRTYKTTRSKFNEYLIDMVDSKIEVGYIKIDGMLCLVVGDSMCPDSMRLVDMVTGKKLDKQLVRDKEEITPEVAKAYARVKETTDKFNMEKIPYY